MATQNPLFEGTSSEKPSKVVISFAADPSGSLGAQLVNLDKGETEEMFSPGYACVARLVEGETVARKCGVTIGDIIVAVNGEGFRRFKADYDDDDLEDVTVKMDGMSVSTTTTSADKGKVLSGLKSGEAYKALLGKIKEVKKAADPSNPLCLSLERYGWDSRPNAWPRFLVARDGDVPAAMLMHQTHEEWKKKMFPIDLTDQALHKVIDAKAVSQVDMAQEGLPATVYVNFAKLQTLQDSCTAEDVVRAFVIFTETLLARAENPRSPKLSQLIDLTGVSISSGFRTDILKDVYGAFEPNYPETLHKMVMYPVSKVVRGTANLMLGFVNEKTRQKFTITDDLSVACEALGWPKEEVESCGGVTEFMEKHAKSVDSLLVN